MKTESIHKMPADVVKRARAAHHAALVTLFKSNLPGLTLWRRLCRLESVAHAGGGVLVALVAVGALLVWIGRGESDVNGEKERDSGGEQ